MLSRTLPCLWLAQRQLAAALWLALGAMVGCHNLSSSLDSPLLHVRRETAVDDPDQIDHWPGWRGGLAHGVSPALSLPTEWSRREHVRFKCELPGRGHSSPVVWGDTIFLTSVVGEGHRAQLALLKLDRDDGQISWQRQVGQPIGTPHLKNGHASATAATDGERVYAYFGAKGLFCFDFDGNRLWHRPLAEQSHEWGTSSSPVLAGGLVLQSCDSQDASFLIAFDKLSGEIVWRASRDSHACWTTPVVVKAGAAKEGPWQVIVNGTGGRDGSNGFVSAYDLWTGDSRWQLRGTADIVCPTAIVGEGLVVTASGVSGPMQAIELAQAGDLSPEIRWQHRNSGPCVPSGVIYHERLYAVTSDGVVSCLALDDGRTLWREQLGGPISASLIAGAGHIYAATEAGEVYVLKAGNEPKIAATNSLHELCLATPAIAENEIFIRTESRLYCISEKSAGGIVEDDPAIAADLSTDTVVSPSDVPIE